MSITHITAQVNALIQRGEDFKYCPACNKAIHPGDRTSLLTKFVENGKRVILTHCDCADWFCQEMSAECRKEMGLIIDQRMLSEDRDYLVWNDVEVI